MTMKGKHHSEETKRKMSKTKKDNPPFMKGKHHTEESNEKNRQAHLGKKLTEEHKRKIGKGLEGHSVSKESAEKTLKTRRERNDNWHTEETKEKISNGVIEYFANGGKSSMEGKCHSEESRKKMSKSHSGKKDSPETIEKKRIASTGRKCSEETKKKLSVLAKERGVPEKSLNALIQSSKDRKVRGPHSEETKNKIGKANEGKVRSEEFKKHLSKVQKGRKRSKEWCENLSKRAMGNKYAEGKTIGSDNGNWSGGTSYFPYPITFNKNLKLEIKKRDNYTCAICGKRRIGKHIAIHHIDYNKNNSCVENLISLCHNIDNCHNKTNNKNNREHWIAFFESIMFEKYFKEIKKKKILIL